MPRHVRQIPAPLMLGHHRRRFFFFFNGGSETVRLRGPGQALARLTPGCYPVDHRSSAGTGIGQPHYL